MSQPGPSRRRFLEDVLDAMADADQLVLHDADGDHLVRRVDVLAALAEELDRP